MAIKTFNAISNSTIWDIVNNTYGTVDDIVKLMRDNGFDNVNKYPDNGEQFIFDDTLIVNQNVLQSNLSAKKFATRDRQSTNEENMKYYEQDLATEFTSNVDGLTSISLLELQGMRVVQCEKEIKPLQSSEWSFNSVSGTITLLGGTTLDNGQTLFILYAKTVTS